MTVSRTRGRQNQTIARTLLDRFLQDDNGNHAATKVNAEEYLAIIRRDVDALLNTRSPCTLEPDEPSPARESAAGYGLPDFTHLSPDSPDDLWRLAAAIRDTVEHFETRLHNIRIEVEDGGGFQNGKFHIIADTRLGLGQLAFTVYPKKLLTRI